MTHIIRVDIRDVAIAREIREVQRLAYGAEAELIKYPGIPQLTESPEELHACGESFYAQYANDHIVGALSWKSNGATLDIHRLVVHPEHWRQGIALRLLRRLETEAETGARIIVQAASANYRAIALYRRVGFNPIGELLVDGGLAVTKFEKSAL